MTTALTPIHEDPHPYAGELVPLLMEVSEVGDQEPTASFRVEDWAGRVYGMPWRQKRSVATTLYALRAPFLGLPTTDSNVLHGTLLGVPMLIHTREIDWSRL